MMKVFLKSSSYSVVRLWRSLTLSFWHLLISIGTSLKGLSLSQSYCNCCKFAIEGDSFTMLLKLKSSLTSLVILKTCNGG